MNSLDLFNESTPIELFYPWSLPFSIANNFYSPIINCIIFSIYIIPLASIFLLVSIFVKKIPKIANYLVIVITLVVMVFCQTTAMVLCANTFRWFLNLPIITYCSFFVTLIALILSSVVGTNYLRKRNSQYAEYKELSAQSKLETKENKEKKTKIKRKLFVAVIGTIFAILLTFSMNCSSVNSTEKPLKVSNLSIVPPV